MYKLKAAKIIFGILALIIIPSLVFYGIDNALGLNVTDSLLNRTRNQLGIEEEPEIDLTPLSVEVLNDQKELIEGFTTVAIKANKPVSIEESSRFSLVNVKQLNEDYFYVVEINNIGTGESTVSFELTDEAANIQEVRIELSRSIAFTFAGQQQVTPWPETNYIIDGDDLLANINKQNRLLNTYEPTDLVNIFETYPGLFVNNQKMSLRSEAALNLNRMINDLSLETGENVLILSTYRPYNEQAEIYSGYLRNDTQESVDTYSARPGYSEHQLGTAVDFTADEVDFQLTAEFDNTTEGKWLTENSYKYGFVKSYGNSSNPDIAYGYEAWHYRFIGVESALEFNESNLELTEWIASQ